MRGLCCSYGGFFAEPAAATAGFGPPEDEEEYARRIWQEMEKRKRQQSGSAASAARTYFAAETQAKSAREQAAFDAAQRSRQILEEEKAKDKAWREAVSKVLCLCNDVWELQYAMALVSSECDSCESSLPIESMQHSKPTSSLGCLHLVG